jgi:hypothetical protein
MGRRLMTKTKLTRSEKNARWIEKFCLIPAGPRKGDLVKLTAEQKQLLRDIYDHYHAPRDIPVTGEMAAYLALLHTVGVEAGRGDAFDPMPNVHPDPWTLWGATSPTLQQHLHRDGAGAIVCHQLGTRFPRRAA